VAVLPPAALEFPAPVGATGLTVGGVGLPDGPLTTPVEVSVLVPFLTPVPVDALSRLATVPPRVTPEFAVN